ncbi:MAG TPA: EamA family transporter [Candidatus Melainabacteria bacterium]|nr:EamA family transporter [Candidatus Melainabacteria bacterium]
MAFSTAEVLTLQIALTIVAWGLWGIFDKLALARAEPKDVFLVTAILAIPQIPLVLFLLTWNYGQWHLSSSLIIYASASSVISSLGMALYLDSMKRADSSVVLGMTAAYPLVTQVLGLLIMGEAFSTTRAIGAVFIALGIVVIGLTDNLSPMLWQPSTALPPDEKDAAKKKERAKDSGYFTGMPVIVTLLLVNLLWGCKGILEKLSLEHGKPLEVYLAETITTLLLLGPVLTFFIWRGYKPALKNKHLWTYTGLSELALAIGGWSYLMALSMAPAGYVVTITSTYPLVMYIIAIFVLKEKLSWMRLAGLACIVCGGMLV